MGKPRPKIIPIRLHFHRYHDPETGIWHHDLEDEDAYVWAGFEAQDGVFTMKSKTLYQHTEKGKAESCCLRKAKELFKREELRYKDSGDLIKVPMPRVRR